MKILKTASLGTSNVWLFIKLTVSRFVVLIIYLSVLNIVLGQSANEFLTFIEEGIFTQLRAMLLQFNPAQFTADGFYGAGTELIRTVYLAIEEIFSQDLGFSGKTALTYLTIAGCYLVWRFFTGVYDLPVTASLESFMVQGKSSSFMWKMYKRLGQSVLYTLLNILITAVADILIFAAVLGLYIMAFRYIGYAGLCLTVATALLLFAARCSILAYWMPSVVLYEKKGVIKGFKNGLKAFVDRSLPVFVSTVITIAVTYSLMAVLVVFVDSFYVVLLGLWVIHVAGFFHLACVNAVQYHEATERPYFTKKLDLVVTDD